MSQKKRLCLENLVKADDLCRVHGLSKESASEFEVARRDIGGFEPIIPVCGCFNAGKSSMLNAFFGGERLPVNILPETAIAAEIRRGAPERVDAVTADGTKASFPLDKIKELTIRDYDHLEVHIESPAFDAIGERVLVDMPGTDSSIEAHNKALLAYLAKGCHYIFVADIEDGTLRGNSLAFLKELKSYGKSFSVVANKSDRKPAAMAAEIAGEMRARLADIGAEASVGLCSAHRAEMKEFAAAASAYDVTVGFASLASPAFAKAYDSAIRELKAQMDSMEMDTAELDNTLRAMERRREEMSKGFDKEIAGMERQFSATAVENVLSEVKQAMRSASGELAQTLMNSGKEAFSVAINEVIRPALVNATQKSMDGAAHHLAGNIEKLWSDFGDLDASSMKGIDPATALKLAEGVAVAMEASVGGLQKLSLLLSKSNAMFKGATGVLAVTTSLVAPWLEVVLIFLPEILKFLFQGPSKEEQIREIASKIEGEIVPSLAAKLRPQVAESLKHARGEMAVAMKTAFDAEIAKIESALQAAKTAREQKAKQFEAEKAAVANGVAAFESLKQEAVAFLA